MNSSNSPLRWLAVAALSALLCGAAAAKKVGEMAPEFARNDLAGKQLHLTDYRGKLVLLNFWATWCAPCREEMPQFSRWQQEYRAKGLQVIGIAMDDDIASVKQLMAQRPVSYPIVLGDAKLGETFGGVLGLPLSYLIDAQGMIVAKYQGESDLKKMEAKLKELLPRERQ